MAHTVAVLRLGMLYLELKRMNWFGLEGNLPAFVHHTLIVRPPLPLFNQPYSQSR
jgi:hypothetical protein